jgi:transforming growth factor-beta-induced protein
MTNILNTIYNTRELSIFSTALKITSIDKILENNGDFTIFVPNNLAFAELSRVNLRILTEEVWRLTEILSIHIIPGRFSYQELLKMYKPGQQKVMLTAIDSSLIEVSLIDGIMFDSSCVLSTDNSANNGIIYIIDRVIIPVSKNRLIN